MYITELTRHVISAQVPSQGRHMQVYSNLDLTPPKFGYLPSTARACKSACSSCLQRELPTRTPYIYGRMCSQRSVLFMAIYVTMQVP